MSARAGEEGLIEAYHRLDVRMRNSVELVELELVIRLDIDVGSLVFGAVAVSRCRED